MKRIQYKSNLNKGHVLEGGDTKESKKVDRIFKKIHSIQL